MKSSRKPQTDLDTTKMENMSHAIAWTGALYVIGAALLLIAAFAFAPRDVISAQPDLNAPLAAANSDHQKT